MPKCLYQYAVVAATALLALAQPANAQNSFADKLEARACAEALTKGKRIMAAPAAMQRRAGQGMDVRYQRLRLAPDMNQLYMNQLYIEGSVFTRFRMLAADTSVTFDLDATLFADSAHYHGRRVPVVHTDNTIQVRLGRAVPAFAEDSVEVFYHGSPPQGSGFGAYTQAYHGPANSPTVWTLSEPYGAREWWPCKQDLADKIEELDVYIRTPRGFKTASNGLLVDTVAGPDGLPVYHWHHSYPIPAYLVAFATANYAEYTKRFALRQDSLLYQNYIYPEGIADWYYNLDNLVDVLRIYDRIYGPYPFKREKYGHAQFMWSGGMEHTTMSFVVSAELSLIGHELAHQWFGDNVTCGSWRDIWLNEGFASYSEALMYENLGDTADYHAFIRGTQSYVLSNGAGSVFCTDTTNVDRIFSSRLTYGKGAMLLHMLRYKLGDSAFFTALRAYQADPLLQYGFARTADLQAHLEAASGQSLTAFFNQWYYGQGYPRYQVNAVQRVADSIAITLYQTTTHPSVPFYAMPVPIRLLYANGDTAWLRLEHTASGQRFSIPTGGYVTRVDFDPESWLLAQHTVYQTLAAKPALQRGAIALHPQPASGSITVTGLPAQGATYTLSDGTGRTLATGYTAGTVALPATTPPGVYLLRLAVGAEAVVLKCIVE